MAKQYWKSRILLNHKEPLYVNGQCYFYCSIQAYLYYVGTIIWKL